MTAVLGVFAAAAALATGPPTLDPQHLPQLPKRGLARELKAGLELETMQGRPLGRLNGLHLAPDKDMIPRSGPPRLLLRTRRFASYWMWGG